MWQDGTRQAHRLDHLVLVLERVEGGVGLQGREGKSVESREQGKLGVAR